MGRYGRRISRSLIGALIVTIVLGLIFYLKNLGTTQAEQNPPAPQQQAATPAPRVVPPTPVIPAPAPAPVVVSAEPATRPQVAMLPPATPPVVQEIKPPSASTLAEAQAKQASGDLLGARTILNDALFSGKLSSADTAAARKALSQINQEVVFGPRRFANDPFGGTYSVQSGDRLARIAAKYDVTWELLMRLNGMTDPTKLRAGQALKVIQGPFYGVVSKSNFTLDIYLGPPNEKGSIYVTTFNVGLGKDDSTPTGSWMVETGKKLKNPTYYSPRQEGVIDADDPKNPLGERWIGLVGIDGHAVGKASYGIHGTIEPDSIGKMDSMGCIRLLNADVEWVFDLLVEGKSIVIVKE